METSALEYSIERVTTKIMNVNEVYIHFPHG